MLPFCMRLILRPVAIKKDDGVAKVSVKKTNNDEINNAILSKDLNKTFSSILTNNIKVGLLNVAGGVVFGIPTIVSLLLNGFTLADMIMAASAQGISINFIVKSLLAPHIIELIGIWLTAAAGFTGAKMCIIYILKNTFPSEKSVLTVLYSTIIGLAIISIAAWLETFVTIKNYL